MEGGHGAGTFAQALAALKRRGCGLLVVGPSCEAQLSACTRLLGEAVAEPRRRVVVLAGGTSGARGRLPDDGADARVIDYRSSTRSAATVQATAGVPGLERLEEEILDAVDACEAAAGDLAPAELRVCVDSLGPLLDANPDSAVESFAETVVDRVRSLHGMAHVHVPAPYDAPAVEALTPAFDAVIEVAPGEQRWHLREEELTTDWLPL